MANGKASKRKRKGTTIDPPVEGISLSNPYVLLSDDDEDPSSILQNSKHARLNAKKEKVPPIVVATPDFRNLRDKILNLAKGFKFSFQIGHRGECRVLAETLEGFNCALQVLTTEKFKFFTYDTKTERLFKVVLKGLASGETLEDIQNEIVRLLGVAPVQVIKMKMKSRPGDSRNGITNDFYLVHFKSSELNNLKALEKARLMLHVRVTWEHFRKTGGNSQNLTQCRKCQGWGHGTRNCHMNAKCMICGKSSHAKDNCPVKDFPDKFKCSNCGENHKSNFWECKTRKAILQSRMKNQVGNAPRSRPGTTSAANMGQRSSNCASVPIGTNQSRPVSNSTAVNNRQRGTNRTSVPIGTNSAHASNSQSAANNRQQINGSTYASIASGGFQNQNLTSDEDDLGSITAPKMQFLQESLNAMVYAMVQTNSMLEAIQIGMTFANNIVMSLKFNNGY